VEDERSLEPADHHFRALLGSRDNAEAGGRRLGRALWVTSIVARRVQTGLRWVVVRDQTFVVAVYSAAEQGRVEVRGLQRGACRLKSLFAHCNSKSGLGSLVTA